MTDGGVIEEKQKDSDRKKSKLINLENYSKYWITLALRIDSSRMVKTKDKRHVKVGDEVLYLYILGDF